jgi:hypothetical protein
MATNIPTVWVVRGLKRSGNHAITHWIAAQGNIEIFNNVLPIVPLLSGQLETTVPRTLNEVKMGQRKRRRKVISRMKRLVMPSPIPMITLEDHHLSQVPLSDINTVKNILILRDPVNTFASRIRKASRGENSAYPQALNDDMIRIINLWKEYAREFIGETAILPNKICIYFNKWYSSVEYRKSVAASLGLKFTDVGYNTISRIGGGSSFEGPLLGKHTLNVLDRSSYLNDSELALLNEVLRYAQLEELIKAIENAAITQFQ